MDFPDFFLRDIERAHPSWQPILRQGLRAVQREFPSYLSDLARSSFLPTAHRLFAAFSIPFDEVRYVLVGEGPYPRDESATGYCFMDGAVNSLWSEDSAGGLSKPVNRATSLRNFIKMLLVAEKRIDITQTTGASLIPAVVKLRSAPDVFVQTMPQLQANFLRHGFLMLNASLVFRPEVAPAVDARAWMVFLQEVVHAIAQLQRRPAFILWGKIADKLGHISYLSEFHIHKSEHPYNLSFIANSNMQSLFAPMRLLHL